VKGGRSRGCNVNNDPPTTEKLIKKEKTRKLAMDLNN